MWDARYQCRAPEEARVRLCVDTKRQELNTTQRESFHWIRASNAVKAGALVLARLTFDPLRLVEMGSAVGSAVVVIHQQTAQHRVHRTIASADSSDSHAHQQYAALEPDCDFEHHGAAKASQRSLLGTNTQFWKPVDQWRRVSCSGSQKLQLSKIRDTVLIKWRRYEASCATFEESYRSHQVVQATQRGAHTSLESGRLDRKISSEKLENEWNGLGIVL